MRRMVIDDPRCNEVQDLIGPLAAGEVTPPTAVAAHLERAGLLDEQTVAVIDRDVQEELAKAVRFAQESPIPTLEGVEADLYA